MNALWEILQSRMVRRGVPTKNLTPGDIERAANDTVRRVITLQQGIPTEAAKDIVKFLKDHKLKSVQAAIQADQVRVSSASKDDLQEAIRLLREHDFGVALQFGNYRGDRQEAPMEHRTDARARRLAVADAASRWSARRGCRQTTAGPCEPRREGARGVQ